VITALCGGRDALCVIPTGAGKSVCYQIPALLSEGVTLVVSPLISLMKDQVTALDDMGVPAVYINSSLDASEYREAFRLIGRGERRIVYIAPERLLTADFLRFAGSADISLVAVDEAHCVSQWGQDFRPSYLKIADFIAELPKRPTVGAFTATATRDVKSDIVRLLGLRDPLVVTTGFDRPNLYFDVVRGGKKPRFLRDYVLRNRGKTGIVYCATRAGVERVCADLRSVGVTATRYHAGLDDNERRENQEAFVYDRARVMVATNAFGMGIDKSNVNFVIHYNMPKNLESYYQEAGRAGRDGESADCILLYSEGDVSTAKFLIQSSSDSAELSSDERESVLRRDMQRLDKMVGYCKTSACLRSYILTYFDSDADARECNNCGNCNGEFEYADITTDAQKILSCVARVEKKLGYGFGAALYVSTLYGARDKRVTQLGLDTLPTHGIMRASGRERIRAIIDFLIAEGFLAQSTGAYPVLGLTRDSGDVLFRGKTVIMPTKKQSAPPPSPRRKRAEAIVPDTETPDVPSDLFEALRALRAELAQDASVPAYVVFSNATLRDMAAKAPRNRAELLGVSGVGEVKAARYGDRFLAAIKDFCG
jgi:ATP-dependent DNA helicase RecQ